MHDVGVITPILEEFKRRHTFKVQIISTDNVGLLWFFSSPRLPLRWKKLSLRVFLDS